MAIPRNLGNLASGADSNGVLGVTKGGTGATSNATAPFALKGANSDITSLTGLTTALSVGQGGTGRATLTANNVLLGNGTTAVNFVAPGTTGNVLTSNGTTWTSAAPSGGDFKFIQQIAPGSGESSFVFTEIPTYRTYFLTFSNIGINSGTNAITFQFGSGGGTPTYVTSGYYNAATGIDSNSNPQSRFSNNASVGNFSFGSDVEVFVGGGVYFYGFQNSASELVSFSGTGVARRNSTLAAFSMTASGYTTIATSPITAIRIAFSEGRTSTGTGVFRLYGVT